MTQQGEFVGSLFVKVVINDIIKLSEGKEHKSERR